MPDYLIIGCFTLLLIFGFVMLASASSNLGKLDFDDSSYYLKHQLIFGFLPGLIGFFIASRLNYRFFQKPAVSVIFLVITIMLLGLVFSPLGFSAKGASRWLELGPLTFQPAELLKLSLIIYLASWLSRKEQRNTTMWQGLLPFTIVLAVISAFLIFQNSTSPVAILLAVSLILYFISGAKWRYLAGIIGAGAIALALVVMITPYRFERITSFLNPEADPGNTGFHLLQAKTAIGAGGLMGVGYGQSSVKYRLPEPMGDSIFAVIGEELGFIGVTVLVGLFAFLVIRIFMLARGFPDKFGQLLLIGFGSIIALQTIVNIGAMSGLLPLTGTPLPFISYGGTQLAVFMTMLGIVANISKYSR